MTHLSGSENYMGTNGATAWPLKFLKRKMFATYFFLGIGILENANLSCRWTLQRKDTTMQNKTAQPLISMVMTHDSILMILIKFLITVTLFPQTV